MTIYFITRKKGDTIVTIMPNRMDNKFHFVNLKSQHICSCGFNTIEEAVDDMERLKQLGEIIDYRKVDI